mgnify:CR=1 FL=1
MDLQDGVSLEKRRDDRGERFPRIGVFGIADDRFGRDFRRIRIAVRDCEGIVVGRREVAGEGLLVLEGPVGGADRLDEVEAGDGVSRLAVDDVVQIAVLDLETRCHLALARSQATKAKVVNDEMLKGTQSLKQEMQRTTGEQQ